MGLVDPMAVTEEADIHRTRQVLLERIRSLPGISFGSLQRSLGLNKGTLEYHLRFLEKKREVFSRKTGRMRTYYSSSHDPSRTVGWEGILPEQRKVLEMIRSEPGLTPDQLLQRTDISKSRLYRIVRSLKEHRVVMEVEKGSGTVYEYVSNEDLIDEMLIELAERFMKGELDRETFLRLKGLLDRKRKGTM